jgi:hypothetical protein
MRISTKSCVLAVATVFAIACPAAAETSWPVSLNPIGEGYPVKGSVCRQMGRSAATVRHLNDTAVLVGCPGSAESVFVRKYVAKIGGRVVDEIDGVTLISISNSQREATVAAQDAAAAAAAAQFQPKGRLRCEVSVAKPMTQCDFGILRKGALIVVKVSLPDGGSRQIYFANGKVAGTDISKADASKRRLATTREIGTFMISLGSERYEVPANVVERAGE